MNHDLFDAPAYTLVWTYERSDGSYGCEIKVRGQLVSTATAPTRLGALRRAARMARNAGWEASDAR